jgi:hypothetical protein
MFNRVSDIDVAAFDSRFDQSLVEQPTCRANKRFALQILAIARLFSHHHDSRCRGSFAEDRLRSEFPKRAGATRACRFTQRTKRRPGRNERRRGFQLGRRQHGVKDHRCQQWLRGSGGDFFVATFAAVATFARCC